ncbi:PQQ-binding-like beta-propeller repeat protein [Pedobacter sp. KR3-3]|uniref:PQQ-binding-like beta-propeller repeat protein n=1 Tax=Pedobacter albus TaxID=3113905 RepID=A0ABU7I4Z2_9SPHI|nr:PQQ-binding-like beta-propeller repeat protein [Pedobacter sp. KR3-3]MEE1944521.1 PQQ-binding-like beta-propeller repeat protein [Pedobacter sp. KR3-3]
MKKLIILLLLALFGFQSHAQFGKLKSLVGGGKAGKKSGNFSTVWESEFSNKASRLAMTNENGTFILGTDDNSATVLNAEGKEIWSGDYKKITTNKTNSCEFQYFIHDNNGGYLFLFDRKSLGKDRIAVLDVASGKELWNSENYQNLLPKDANEDTEIETVKYLSELDAFLITQKDALNLVKAKTGEKVWETKRFTGSVGKYRYDKASNTIVMFNYKPTLLAALFSGFKNQLVKIDANNGEILWENEFRGTVEKELVTRKAVADLEVRGNRIYFWLDGLQTYDMASGKKLWEVTYENDMRKSGNTLFGGSQKAIYRTLADPIFTDAAVYLVVFGGANKTKYVEKHDLQSGKLIWQSEKITGALSMPNIYKTGNRIMVQVGGKVQVQEIKHRRTSSGLEIEYNVYYDYMAQKNGILSLDDATGQTVWRSERFDKRITDMIIDHDKTVFVGDGDEFYAYDIETGKQLFDVKHNDAKVGKATDVIDFGDDVVVLSEKGLASYKKADGRRNYATEKISGVDYFYHLGDNYFLRDQKNSKNIIYGVDLSNGDIKGSVSSKGKGGSPVYGAGLDITADGEYIFAFKGKKIEKIKVNN